MNRAFRKGTLLRRLSVFYLFFFILILVFVFYQYIFKPGNASELTERGQRVLNQLSSNFMQKNKEMQTVFRNYYSSAGNYQKKPDHLKKLGQTIPFLSDTIKRKSAKDKVDSVPDIHRGNNGEWDIFYPEYKTSKINHFITSVHVRDFSKSLFSVREDIFSSFLLLLDNSNQDINGSRTFQVVYDHDNLSSSSQLNLDTLSALQKNSDLSAVTAINISGTRFRIFVQSFMFYKERLLIAGLMTEDQYAKQLNTTPYNFLPRCIVIIILLLVFVPFLKLYFLGPRESVNALDLKAVVVSFYGGSAILVMMLFYLISSVMLESTFNNRLEQIGGKLQADIQRQMDSASHALDTADQVYKSLDRKEKNYLALKDTGTDIGNSVDRKMTPLAFKSASRIFWIDERGKTIAKWNAFNFTAPLTDVNGEDWFKLYNKRVPKGLSFYTGKSNITEEFQVLFTKPSSIGEAATTCIAGFISCSEHALLAPGFGFAIIDPSGKVLVHSEPSRNLSENFFEEAGNNLSLKKLQEYRNSDEIAGFHLYGEDVNARLLTVRDQPIYIIVYYGKSYITDHIMRALQFTAGITAALLISVLLCMWMVTLVNENAGRLSFPINNIEWIRPAVANNTSYVFCIRFYKALTGLYIGFSLLVLAMNGDLVTLVYMAALLPFYCILCFIYSRKKQVVGPGKKVLLMISYPIAFIALVNAFILLLTCKMPMAAPMHAFILLFLFQLAAVVALLLCRAEFIKEKENENDITSTKILYTNYLTSAGLSIVLVGLLPVMGILIYAWAAEGLQMRKTRMLELGASLENRRNYFSQSMAGDYSKEEYHLLDSSTFTEKLAFSQGAYLFDDDRICPGPLSKADSNKSTVVLGDELYSMLNEYPFPLSSHNNLIVLQNKSADSSWYFLRNKSENMLALSYRGLQVRTTIENPLLSIFNGNGLFLTFMIFMTVLFILMGRRLIKNIIGRLFLEDYASVDKIKVDNGWLANFFAKEAPIPCCLHDVTFPNKITPAFFDQELGTTNPGISQGLYTGEEYIIAMTESFGKIYNRIWDKLLPDEKFVLYDFSIDRLTNYKNTDTLFRLMHYGLLVKHGGTLDVFAPSFRNYVLNKTGYLEKTKEINEYEQPGVWATIRIPLFSLVAVAGIFLLVTQSDTTHRVTGFIASVTALFPLLMKLVETRGKPEAS